LVSALLGALGGAAVNQARGVLNLSNLSLTSLNSTVSGWTSPSGDRLVTISRYINVESPRKRIGAQKVVVMLGHFYVRIHTPIATFPQSRETAGYISRVAKCIQIHFLSNHSTVDSASWPFRNNS